MDEPPVYESEGESLLSTVVDDKPDQMYVRLCKGESLLSKVVDDKPDHYLIPPDPSKTLESVQLSCSDDAFQTIPVKS